MVALNIKSETQSWSQLSGESESKLRMEIVPGQSGVEQQLVLLTCSTKFNNCLDSLTKNRRSMSVLHFLGWGSADESSSLSALLLLEQPAFTLSLSSMLGKNSEPSDSGCSLEAEEALKQASKFLAAKVCATAFSELYSDLPGLTNFSHVFPSVSVCSSDHFAGRLKLFLEPASLPRFSADFLPLRDAIFFNVTLLIFFFFFFLPDAMLNTIHYAGAVCNACTGTTSHLATVW